MRILFQVVSDAAEIVRGVIELVGGIVVEVVRDLVPCCASFACARHHMVACGDVAFLGVRPDLPPHSVLPLPSALAEHFRPR